MDADAVHVTQLVAELFLAIKLIAGYPTPAVPPQIHVLGAAEIRKALCKGPCGDIKAYYLHDRGVFVNASLDFEHDLTARSVLLHELVHHVQDLSGKFEKILSQCDRWYSKELEAYEVQNEYLRQHHETRRYILEALPGMCRDGMRMTAPDEDGARAK
jgi:hypothetical protein